MASSFTKNELKAWASPMEQFFNETTRQQQRVNKTLKYFSNLLESYLEKNQGSSVPKDEIDSELLERLIQVFGIKGQNESIPIKPSNLFSSIPDIERLRNFQTSYSTSTLSRQIVFDSSFKRTIEEKSGYDSFLDSLESMYSSSPNKEALQILKIIYNIRKTCSIFERKHSLTYDYYDQHILKEQSELLFQPNYPLDGVSHKIYRLLLTFNLFTPYDLDNGHTALKSFQIM